MTERERIDAALTVAVSYGGIDGDHHKAWVIDQMVRALTGCLMVQKMAYDSSGRRYRYAARGTSAEYRDLVHDACDGEDGPNSSSWDEGTPP